ncbi:uncharacterized protein LOC121371017 [Gigantopelta aegis]|uniref:uncharacterized protein LOC121371017 n=1 Tax=Gigantopelta aegis TaxID=1735272 RepID=UPI001B88D6FE|nr:uncharacterized protein LOC121371017 [Gigantopelta aegis]
MGKFGMFSRRGMGTSRGGFGGFFSSLKKKLPVPMCNFYSGQLPMSVWPEKSDICMPQDKTLFPYPGQLVERALRNDAPAAQILQFLTLCSQSVPTIASYGTYAMYRFQDVCPVERVLVDKVWKMNKYSNPPRKDVCYVVHPDQQNIEMSVCRTNCTMDTSTISNHFCIPDGFVERSILVFCPWDIASQCQLVKIRVPRGCSCKKYTCLKYQ